MLAVSLVGFAAAFCTGLTKVWRNAGPGRGISRREPFAFACGWLALVVALLSPLDDWSERLFVAHMAQHELLMVVAAPLMALSSPLVAMLWALPAPARRRLIDVGRQRLPAAAWTVFTAAPAVWLLHALALWIWHLPSLYNAALEHESVHAGQHLTFFLTAVLFWWTLVRGRYGRLGYGAAVVYLFATALQSGVLGALIAFSPDLWYPAYTSSSRVLGLTPLEDQQLAGLLMWVPAGLVFTIAGLAFFAAWLRESGRRIRLASFIWLLVAALGAGGCRSQEQLIKQQERAFVSLQATAAAVSKEWLSGTVSGTFARIALEKTQQLAEQQRAQLASAPERLTDPAAAALTARHERLSRTLAILWKAVNERDAAGVREHLAEIDSWQAASP